MQIQFLSSRCQSTNRYRRRIEPTPLNAISHSILISCLSRTARTIFMYLGDKCPRSVKLHMKWPKTLHLKSRRAASRFVSDSDEDPESTFAAVVAWSKQIRKLGGGD